MRARLLAAVLASALLISGCANVPTSGPIRNGSAEGPVPVGRGIGVEAQPPRQNAKPLAIVNGFLEAMSDSRAFDVARQYLTPDAAAAWKPETKTVVYDQSSTKAVTAVSDSAIELRAPLIGTIDSRGSWTPAPRGALATFRFRIAEADGQYRIANAPSGVFLGSNQLETQLSTVSLYFLNRERTMLVPDPVYLPFNLPAGQRATQLIQGLLRGPTDRLGNGVGTAAPPGTEVNVSVPVDIGVATVALSNAAIGLSEQDKRLLAAQITWTLRPISTRVRITIDGAKLHDDWDTVSYSDFSEYDPSVPANQMKELYGVRNGKIVRITQDGSAAIGANPVDSSPLYQYRVESLAVDLGGQFAAAVTTVDGERVVAVARLEPGDKGDKVEIVATAGDVLRPTFDVSGNLWILDRATSGRPRLRLRSEDGKLTEIRTNFGTGRPVQFRIAPDGVRALVVQRLTTGGTVVQIGTVAPDDGNQLALGNLRSLQLPLVDITDATWYQNGVLVAGRPRNGAPRQPWLVNVDGSQPRPMPGASNDFQAVKVAANPNIDTLPVVKDPDGQLHWQTKDLGWAALDDDPHTPIDPVYPG